MGYSTTKIGAGSGSLTVSDYYSSSYGTTKSVVDVSIDSYGKLTWKATNTGNSNQPYVGYYLKIHNTVLYDGYYGKTHTCSASTFPRGKSTTTASGSFSVGDATSITITLKVGSGVDYTHSSATSGTKTITRSSTTTNYSYLNIAGNSGTYLGSSTYKSGAVASGGTVTLAAPKRNGYKFLGWTRTVGGSISGQTAADGTFRSGNPVGIYNNSSNGNVVHTRMATNSTTGNPLGTGYVLKIETKGAASPGHGGFVMSNYPGSAANSQYVHTFVAKLPKGYNFAFAHNAMGSDYKEMWLTDNKGTGGWETYAYLIHAGSSGTFSTFSHVYVLGGAAPLTWYLAYAQVNYVSNDSKVTSSDPMFRSSQPLTVYDNSNSGNVTITRMAANDESGYPGGSGYVNKIVSKANVTPNLGGFYQTRTVSANHTYIHQFYARLPKGYKFEINHNAIGGGNMVWITDNQGTGDWQMYAYYCNAGNNGSYSSFGFISVVGTPPVTWYIAYNQIYNLSQIYTYSGTTDGTLTAEWFPETYRVYYNTDGGEGLPSYETFQFTNLNKDVISTEIPTKSGYKFTNWHYYNPNDGVDYYFNPGDLIPSNWGNFTVAANWMLNEAQKIYINRYGYIYARDFVQTQENVIRLGKDGTIYAPAFVEGDKFAIGPNGITATAFKCGLPVEIYTLTDENNNILVDENNNILEAFIYE